MPKLLTRLITLLLVPALVADPGIAISITGPTRAPARLAKTSLANILAIQALSLRTWADREKRSHHIGAALARRTFLFGAAATVTATSAVADTQRENLALWQRTVQLTIQAVGNPAAATQAQAALQKASEHTDRLRQADPGWAEIGNQMFQPARTLAVIVARPQFEPERASKALSALQDMNEQILIDRGWLLLWRPSAGFGLGRIKRSRKVIAVSREDGRTVRRRMTAWIGAEEPIGATASTEHLFGGEQYGPSDRPTIFIDESNLNLESALIESLLDSDSGASRASPEWRSVILDALAADGWVEPVAPGSPRYRWKRTGYREAVERVHIAHEIGHALKAGDLGLSLRARGHEACQYLTHLLGPLAYTHLALFVDSLLRAALLGRRLDPEIPVALAALARDIGRSDLIKGIEERDAKAIVELFQVLAKLKRDEFRRRVRSARTELARRLPGPADDWDVEFPPLQWTQGWHALPGAGAIVALTATLLKLRTRTETSEDATPASIPPRALRTPIVFAVNTVLWGLEEIVFRDLVYGHLESELLAKIISIGVFALLHPVLERVWLRLMGGDRLRFEPEPLGRFAWRLWLRFGLAYGFDAAWGGMVWIIPAHYFWHYAYNLAASAWNRWIAPRGWPRLPLMSLAGPSDRGFRASKRRAFALSLTFALPLAFLFMESSDPWAFFSIVGMVVGIVAGGWSLYWVSSRRILPSFKSWREAAKSYEAQRKARKREIAKSELKRKRRAFLGWGGITAALVTTEVWFGWLLKEKFSKKHDYQSNEQLANLRQIASALRVLARGQTSIALSLLASANEYAKTLKDESWAKEMGTFTERIRALLATRQNEPEETWLPRYENAIVEANDRSFLHRGWVLIPTSTQQLFYIGRVHELIRGEATHIAPNGTRTMRNVPICRAEAMSLREGGPIESPGGGAHKFGTDNPFVVEEVTASGFDEAFFQDMLDPTSERSQNLRNSDIGWIQEAYAQGLAKDGWVQGGRLRSGFKAAYRFETLLHEVAHVFNSSAGVARYEEDEAFAHLGNLQGRAPFTRLAKLLLGAYAQMIRAESLRIPFLDRRKPFHGSYMLWATVELAASSGFSDLADRLEQLNAQALEELWDRLFQLDAKTLSDSAEQARQRVGMKLPARGRVELKIPGQTAAAPRVDALTEGSSQAGFSFPLVFILSGRRRALREAGLSRRAFLAGSAVATPTLVSAQGGKKDLTNPLKRDIAQFIADFADRLRGERLAQQALRVEALHEAFEKTEDPFLDRGGLWMGIEWNAIEVITTRRVKQLAVRTNPLLWAQFFRLERARSPQTDSSRTSLESSLLKEAIGLDHLLKETESVAAGLAAGIRYSEEVQSAVRSVPGRQKILQQNPTARDAAMTRLASHIHSEAVGYVEMMKFLHHRGMTRPAIQGLAGRIPDTQGELKDFLADMSKLMNQNLIDGEGKINERQVKLMILDQVVQHRNTVDSQNARGTLRGKPFTFLGLGTIVMDVLRLEGLTPWPARVRRDQLKFLEDPLYYAPKLTGTPQAMSTPRAEPPRVQNDAPHRPAFTRFGWLRRAA